MNENEHISDWLHTCAALQLCFCQVSHAINPPLCSKKGGGHMNERVSKTLRCVSQRKLARKQNTGISTRKLALWPRKWCVGGGRKQFLKNLARWKTFLARLRCLVKMSYSPPWNLKHPFINGSLNWMMKKLYMKNGCFTISIHFKLVVWGSRPGSIDSECGQSHQGYKWWPCNTDPAICTSHRSIHHWGIQIMQDGALSLVMNGVITCNPCKWLKING